MEFESSESPQYRTDQARDLAGIDDLCIGPARGETEFPHRWSVLENFCRPQMDSLRVGGGGGGIARHRSKPKVPEGAAPSLAVGNGLIYVYQQGRLHG